MINVAWIHSLVARIAYLRDAKAKAEGLLGTLKASLGLQWTKFARVPELKVAVEAFIASIEPDNAFYAWEAEMKQRNFHVSGALLAAERRDDGSNGLRVNFDKDIAQIYEEVVALQDYGYAPSFDITLRATQGHAFKGLSTQLEELLAQYHDIISRIPYSLFSSYYLRPSLLC